MKSSKRKKYYLLTFWIIILFVLSYLRESSFIVVNAVIDGESHNYANINPPDFLYQYSPQTLKGWKWGLTLFSMSLFTGISLLAIRSLFDRIKAKMSAFIYLLIWSILLLITIISWLSSSFDSMYPTIRMISGLIQSPLIFIFLFMTFFMTNAGFYSRND